jgi:hypothetical protein
MQLNYIINELDKQITASKTELVLLEERKIALIKLATKYPDAHLEKNNTVCIDNLWDKMSCMRVAWGWGYGYGTYGSMTKVNVRFSVGKKDMEDGIRIHSYPYNNTVATIAFLFLPNPNNTYPRRVKEITVLNYSNMIPDACPKRKVFLKRIRNYLLNIIIKENMKINNNSYNTDEFERLILFK